MVCCRRGFGMASPSSRFEFVDLVHVFLVNVLLVLTYLLSSNVI